MNRRVLGIDVGTTGVRAAPIWNARARAVIFGADLTHGRAELYRALMEGIALGFKHAARVAEECGWLRSWPRTAQDEAAPCAKSCAMLSASHSRGSMTPRAPRGEPQHWRRSGRASWRTRPGCTSGSNGRCA